VLPLPKNHCLIVFPYINHCYHAGGNMGEGTAMDTDAVEKSETPVAPAKVLLEG